MEHIIKTELAQAAQVLQTFMSDPVQTAAIARAAHNMGTSIRQGGKIISCGNGGSHCDAMHFAEELTGRYRENRQALPAICISNPAHLSCVSNDYGFEYVFSRYIEALGRPGDTLLGISTSGQSKNILRAAEAARDKKMQIIILGGKDGGALASLADVEIRVPHFGFADRIQEIHIKVIHILILLIEKQMSEPYNKPISHAG